MISVGKHNDFKDDMYEIPELHRKNEWAILTLVWLHEF